MRALSLWSRRYHVRRILAAAAIEVAAWRALGDPLRVPGRGPDIEWVLSPLIPSLLAMSTPDALGVAHEDLEIVAGHRVACRRAAVAAVIIVVSVAAAVCGEPAGDARTVAIRNALQLVGIAFWSAMLLPRTIAWAPAMLVPLIMWLIGTPDPGRPVPDWALLLRDDRSQLAGTAAAFTLTTGALAYMCRERPFRSRGREM